jgi:hypothetical protein
MNSLRFNDTGDTSPRTIAIWSSIPAGNYLYEVTGDYSWSATSSIPVGTTDEYTQNVGFGCQFVTSATVSGSESGLGFGTNNYDGGVMTSASHMDSAALIHFGGPAEALSVQCTQFWGFPGVTQTMDYSNLTLALVKLG